MQHAGSSFNEIVQRLAAFLTAQGVQGWLVGGTPRDLLLGRAISDIDVAIDTDGVVLARSLADSWGGSFVPLDTERGTGRVVLPEEVTGGASLVIDLVQLRAATIEADLALRDVTINAMAMPLAGEQTLLDPLGGQADLAIRQLRACGPTSISDDPLRILRAVRLAALLNFHIAGELDAQLRASAGAITNVAVERVREELLKLCATSVAGYWLGYLDAIGVLTRLFPELEPARTCDQPRIHFLPVLAHSIETVVVLDWLFAIDEQQEADHLPVAVQKIPGLTRTLPYQEQIMVGLRERRGGGVPRLALLKLAALLHDNAKPQTKELHEDGSVSFHGHQDIGAVVALAIAQRLRISRADSNYLGMIVKEHMRPGQLRAAGEITQRAMVRFFRDTGGAGSDVLIHELADHMATRGPATTITGWDAHLAWIGHLLQMHYQQPPAPIEPLLRGDELMAELEMQAGPLVGELLREIAEARASGEISDREAALALARRMYAEVQAQTNRSAE
jgi:tRNA nucleotidyltransferase/poly(A) polymerase